MPYKHLSLNTPSSNELGFLTPRDQSQTLSGWSAQPYGTLNHAADKGFCSAGMYSIPYRSGTVPKT